MNSHERIRIERAERRIRTYLGGELVADTTRPTLVWEVPYHPTYYFPLADVREELLVEEATTVSSPGLGEGEAFAVRTAAKEVPGAAVRYPESPVEELRGLIRFDWEAMDAWFEEDEEVFTHPRDPYTRIDILPSSRTVRVEVDGVTVAETHSPTLLFESGLPARYYIPKTHVRMDLLVPSDRVTRCPYKGEARHWSVRAGDDVRADMAWSYPSPLPESHGLAGLVAFYDEKADIYVDGVRQDRPRTKFA